MLHLHEYRDAAVTTDARRYDPATMFLHWATAFLVVTQWGLYALLVAMVLVGMFLAWTRGDSIFNLFSIPAFDPGNRALADQVQEVHATIAWLILALAGLHASATLVHRCLWHDGVLGRMLPRG